MSSLIGIWLASGWRAGAALEWGPDLVVPYLVLLANCLLFSLVRHIILARNTTGILLLLLEEFISTLELCAQCAELNIVYDLHGKWVYGITLCLLTYYWSWSFGEAHATPLYVLEEWLVDQPYAGKLPRPLELVRLLGQTGALPLATRLAALYWSQRIIARHAHYHDHYFERCQSALATTTIKGFLVEFACSLVYRLVELTGRQLMGRRTGAWAASLLALLEAVVSSALVVAALEHSGGYMNPMLASSLEYGCAGADNFQHFLVFWLGPLLGHVMARKLHHRCHSVAYTSPVRAGTNTSTNKVIRTTAAITTTTTRQAPPTGNRDQNRQRVRQRPRQ